jgi:hypothetical protein
VGRGQAAAQPEEQGDDEGVAEEIRDEGDAEGEEFE